MFKLIKTFSVLVFLCLCACAAQSKSSFSQDTDTKALYKSCYSIVQKNEKDGLLCRAVMQTAADSTYTGIMAGLYAASQKGKQSSEAADYGREIEKFFKCQKSEKLLLTSYAGEKDISGLAASYVAWIDQDKSRLNMSVEETVQKSLLICPNN